MDSIKCWSYFSFGHMSFLNVAARWAGAAVRVTTATWTPWFPGHALRGESSYDCLTCSVAVYPVGQPSSQDLESHGPIAVSSVSSYLSLRPSASGWVMEHEVRPLNSVGTGPRLPSRCCARVPWPAAVLGGTSCWQMMPPVSPRTMVVEEAFQARKGRFHIHKTCLFLCGCISASSMMYGP